MKHATLETLVRYKPLLKKISAIEGLKEKKTGVYYVKSKAFLHFHEDDGDLFADVRLNPPEFDRLPATTARDQDSLIAAIKKHRGIT